MNRTVVGFALTEEISMVAKEMPVDSQKVLVDEMRESVAGSPITIARTLAVLGMPAHILGVVGKDGGAPKFEMALNEWRISHHLFPLRDRTPKAFCVINGGGESKIYSHRGPLVLDGQESTVLEEIRQVVNQQVVGCVVATSIRPEDCRLAEVLFASAPEGTLRVLNPNLHLIRQPEEFRELCTHTQLLIVNRAEAAAILQKSSVGPAEWLVDDLLRLRFAPEVIVTCGGGGSTYGNVEGEKLYQPVPKVKVVDTTGAGHAYLAGLVAGRLKGYSNQESMRLAAAVAAAKITHLGGYNPPTSEEVRAYF